MNLAVLVRRMSGAMKISQFAALETLRDLNVSVLKIGAPALKGEICQRRRRMLLRLSRPTVLV